MSRDPEDPKLVTIHTAMGPLRAEVIRSKLEAAGIPVLLRYESAGLVHRNHRGRPGRGQGAGAAGTGGRGPRPHRAGGYRW